MVYLISYDLHENKDYDSLTAAIESYPAHCHILESVWIIGTKNELNAVYKKLLRVIDDDDNLIVAEMVNYAGQLSAKHWPRIEKIFKAYCGDQR